MEGAANGPLSTEVEHALARCHREHAVARERETVASVLTLTFDPSGHVTEALVSAVNHPDNPALDACVAAAARAELLFCSDASRTLRYRICSFADAEVSGGPTPR